MTGPLAIGALTQAFGIRIGFGVCGGLALVLVGVLGITRPRASS